MAGFMSKCPFWSNKKEKIECYRECPILVGDSSERQENEHCVFNECTESSNINFRDIMKEEYGFLNLSIYDDDKNININY